MTEKTIPIAKMILAHTQSLPVRYRLLRDVLKRPANDPELMLARTALDDSIMVQMLAKEQWEDGSWGRMHSVDTSRKQKIKTTESGVQRAVALGLSREHPICSRASAYLNHVLDGEQAFPDPPESNDRWPVGERLFLTATLALIEPEHPQVLKNRVLWQTILQRTFQSGSYNADDEVAAHIELTGATTMRGSYLVLHNRYAVALLGSTKGKIAPEIESAYLDWLVQLPHGMQYIGVRMNEPPKSRATVINAWFSAWELLSHFPQWKAFAQPAIDWLWSQQRDDGLWDLGPHPTRTGFLPLSDSWRKKYTRAFDWSTRVLLLMKAFSNPIS